MSVPPETRHPGETEVDRAASRVQPKDEVRLLGQSDFQLGTYLKYLFQEVTFYASTYFKYLFQEVTFYASLPRTRPPYLFYICFISVSSFIPGTPSNIY